MSNWISVKDKLPEGNMMVNWLCADGIEDLGFYYHDKGKVFATWDLKSLAEITHWKPRKKQTA